MNGIPSPETIGGPSLGISGIGGLIILVINLLILLNMAGGFIFLLLGGVRYITAGGDPDKLATAKRSLTFAVFGIVFAILASALVVFLGSFFGVDVSFLSP